MDPASAIGVASAVLTVVNLIARSVASLSHLQSKYGAADLKVTLLIGQLSTVKAALNQMAKLLAGDCGTLRDLELIADLTMSLECVKAVVTVLDDKISRVQRDASYTLTLRSKANFVWDEQAMDDYLNLLNNQIHALGLLLAALQCRTALEQSNLLQRRNSRYVFDRLKDDTSSLLCLRDTESYHTCQTDGTQDLGTLKATFVFDPEVFNSKVYQMATRSNMIQALQSGRHDVPDNASVAQTCLHNISDMDTPTHVYGSMPTIEGRPGHSGHLATQGGIEVCTSYSVNVSTEEATQMTRPRTPTATNLPRMLGNAVTKIQSKESLTSPPKESEIEYTPSRNMDQKLSQPSNGPREPGLPQKRGDSSAYRQLESFQRSRRGDVTSLPGSADTSIGQVQKHGVKVLILGIADSGKTTLQKSINIAFEKDNRDWRLFHKPAIYMCFFNSLEVLASKILRQQKAQIWTLDQGLFELDRNYRIIAEWLQNESRGVSEMYSFPPAVASAAIALSEDNNIRVMKGAEMLGPGFPDADPFYMVNSNYIVSSASEILDFNYIPSFADILWAKDRTIGLHESDHVIDGNLHRFFDVGGTRAERRNWSREFRDVNSIIFTFDVSCYDQVLTEDSATNQMTEQLAVWDSLVRAECFAMTNFIVLFTKIDKITPSKLKISPFKSLFQDYTGKPESLKDIQQHLKKRLHAASNEWTTRSIVFRYIDSSWVPLYSGRKMAEAALSALRSKGYDPAAGTRATRPVAPGVFGVK